MKKNTVYLILLIIFSIMAILVITSVKKEKELKQVRLNEVVHSVFYAPQYVALEKGFFEEEGLEIELSVGQGADKSMVALISGSADIALMGTEASLYVYNEGKEDFAVSFAQLTQRAGNFLVARENYSDFKWDDVRGKTIIGGRAGGMPQMLLEYILMQNGIKPFVDVEIVNNLQFTSTAGAFVGGVGDFTAEFEPSALAIEKQNAGHVVKSLGLESGYVPYTVYMAQKSYIEKNPEIVQKFTNAIYKSQLWCASHTSEEIAKVIQPYFSENTLEDLVLIVERYRVQETWKNNPVFEEDGLNLLQDIMESGGELSARVPYKDIVNTAFAEKAIQSVK